jgi:probable rRNA maturation factor
MVELLVRPDAKPLLSAPERRALLTRLRSALATLGLSSSHVSLLLTTDGEIRQLNRDYRAIDRATDVLSFHQQELRDEQDPAGRGAFLGDLVISLETARRRSGGRRLPGELARLAIHGLCHLLGHDHKRPAQALRMRRLEARLLRASRPAAKAG